MRHRRREHHPRPNGSRFDDQWSGRLHDQFWFGGCRTSKIDSGGSVRFGNVEIRPVGGAVGCLTMLLVSVVASIMLTILLNLLL